MSPFTKKHLLIHKRNRAAVNVRARKHHQASEHRETRQPEEFPGHLHRDGLDGDRFAPSELLETGVDGRPYPVLCLPDHEGGPLFAFWERDSPRSQAFQYFAQQTVFFEDLRFRAGERV